MQPSGDLRRIAVIGAGPAGRDLAFRCVRAGFEVILEDVMPSRLRSAEQTLASDPQAGALRLATTVEDAVRDADLAIDFVPDELESKLEIFSMLDRMAPPRTILCTPTTSLSIADLSSCTYRPQLCSALNFRGTDSAELVRTSRSAGEALGAVEHWLKRIGYSLTVENDPAETPRKQD
jgi:3-hydroxybutyryl-CoA dehydrogenase